MKTLSILTITAFACLPIHANIPMKQPLKEYSGLWTNSPFTAKPPIVQTSSPVNPFEDFTLTGIAPVPGGHRITIISKKNPDVKKIIEPGGTSEFKVVSVNRNPEKALGTSVVLSSGSIQGTVTFEPELITLKAAPAAPAAPQGNQNLPPGVTNPNLPPGVNIPPTPNQNPNGQAAQRVPRPRIVPPPAPAAAQPPQNQPSGDRRDNRRR
jgi:hypothetical protein